jgi:hypothetical protein
MGGLYGCTEHAVGSFLFVHSILRCIAMARFLDWRTCVNSYPISGFMSPCACGYTDTVMS